MRGSPVLAAPASARRPAQVLGLLHPLLEDAARVRHLRLDVGGAPDQVGEGLLAAAGEAPAPLALVHLLVGAREQRRARAGRAREQRGARAGADLVEPV